MFQTNPYQMPDKIAEDCQEMAKSERYWGLFGRRIYEQIDYFLVNNAPGGNDPGGSFRIYWHIYSWIVGTVSEIYYRIIKSGPGWCMALGKSVPGVLPSTEWDPG